MNLLDIMKRILIAACLSFCFMGVSCTEKDDRTDPLKFETSVAGEFAHTHIGFGYNHYPLDLYPDGSDNPVWTEDRYRMMEERIRAIHPGLVRMPVVRDWYNPSLKTGEYDWNTPEMKACYKFFDLYKEMGVKVLSGWWHVTSYTDDKNGYKDMDNVTAFVDFIDYMINVKGYDNIVYMQPSNEPYGTYTVFDDWSRFMKEAYAQCKKRGVPADRLCGPDSWDDWVGKAAQANSGELISYNFHFYFDGTAASNANLGIYDQLMAQMNQVYKYDLSGKPVVCGEVGAINDSHLDWPSNATEGQIFSWDYIYAVYMVDYAIQSMRAGVSASLSWGLQGFDQNKDGGMWNNTGNWGGTKLRPMFYAWSLLCRCFPDGAVCLDMTQPSGSIKTAGARIGSDDYSFVICSLASYDEECTIYIPAGSKRSYRVYPFNEDNQGDGEQLCIESYVIEADGSITVKVPSESAVILTTLPSMQ